MALKYDKILGQLREKDASSGTGGAVDSVAGRTGDVVLTKSDVGLTNVDNTSDANKPVSTATATALSGKAATSHTHAITDTTGLQTALDGKQAAGSYAAASHTHTASQITDFQTTVSVNSDVAANTTARHTHSNKTTLDSITAAYTTAEQTKLSGIETGAQVNTVTPSNSVTLTNKTINTGSNTLTIGANLNGQTYSITNFWDGTFSGDVTGANLSGTNTGDQDLSSLVPKTTTVNSKALSSDITLTNTDVGAAAASHTHAQSNITNLTTDLAAKAPLASPTFTGTVTLPAGQVVNGVTLTTSGGTSNFLRADGTYAAPPGGGGGLSFSQIYAITTLMG